jgi:hypothetical protein
MLARAGALLFSGARQGAPALWQGVRSLACFLAPTQKGSYQPMTFGNVGKGVRGGSSSKANRD